MPLIAESKTGKDFELPKPGLIQGALAEVRDLGLQDQTYNGVTKKVHKVLFRWQLAELDTENKPKRIYERFTLSLHEKAGLRKRVKQIIGKEPPTTLDVEKLQGLNGMLVVEHNPSKDGSKMYANIVAVMALPAGTPKLEIVKIDPPKAKQEVAGPGAGTDSRAVTAEHPIGDEDIPF